MTIWTQSRAPYGVILVDEVESIGTDEPKLREYLAPVERVVASRVGDPYVGQVVA